MTDEPANKSSLTRDTGAYSIATLFSRILGYGRDAALAAAVPTELTDLFWACFRLPNTFRRLFGEGAVSVAFIPTYSRVAKKDPEGAQKLFGSTLLAVGLATLLATVIGILASPWFLPFYLDLSEGEMESGLLDTTAAMLAWMFPYLILICLAAVAIGVLNAKGRFFVPAATPALFNLALLISVFVYWWFPDSSILWLGIGVLVGGMLQLLFLIPSVVRSEAVPVFSKNPFSDPNLKRALALFLPATLTLGVTQINLLVNTKFALDLGEGPNSYLFYANRLADLPLGLFGIAIAAAAFPRFSTTAADEDREKIKSPLLNSLTGTLLVSLPSMVGLWVLAEPLVDLLFNRGEFAAHGGLEGTVAPLRVYVLGLISFTCVKIFGNLCYAVGDARTPVVAGLCSVATNLVLAYWLRFTWLEHSGIALAVVCGATVNALVMIIRLRERIALSWLVELLWPACRIALAALIMGGVLRFLLGMLPEGSNGLSVPLGIVVGGGIYAGLAILLFPEQAKILSNRLKRS